MTQDVVKLRFKIGAYTPDTIPMERLAEYMRDLAAMLGEPSAVHFVEMTESSTNIVHAVEFEAYAKVEARVESVRRGMASDQRLSVLGGVNNTSTTRLEPLPFRRIDATKCVSHIPIGIKRLANMEFQRV